MLPYKNISPLQYFANQDIWKKIYFLILSSTSETVTSECEGTIAVTEETQFYSTPNFPHRFLP